MKKPRKQPKVTYESVSKKSGKIGSSVDECKDAWKFTLNAFSNINMAIGALPDDDNMLPYEDALRAALTVLRPFVQIINEKIEQENITL